MALVLTDQQTNVTANDLTNNGATEYTATSPFTAATTSAGVDGSGSKYLTAADTTDNSFTNDFTIECWVRWSTLPNNAINEFVWKSGAYNFNFHYTLGLRLFTYPFDSVAVAWSPSVDTWYHVAVTFASNQVKFYVNGSQQGTTQTAANSSTADTTNSLTIGDSSDQGGTPNGALAITEVRLWSVVRTATQISNYRSTMLSGAESSLVAYYPFRTRPTIAWDAATFSDDNSGSATTLTYSHTCTGSNRILLVGVGLSGETDDVTGVTYNGVAMTRIGFDGNSASQAVSSYLYYLIAPATGANNVVVSVSSGQNISSVASSYTGAKQTGQPDSSATNDSSTGTTLDLTTTVVATGSWLASVYWNLNGRTKPSSTVYRPVSGDGGEFADSNVAVSTGSNTHQWTTSSSGSSQAGVIASIAPVPSAASGPRKLAMMGVG